MDYAATSAVRPPEVADAVAEFLRGVGCTPGRGGHSGAVEAARIAFRCRRAVAQALALPGDPGRIAFAHNATHALNAALHGLLRPGDVLVVTQYDHNAVLRPAHYLAQSRGVKVRTISGDPSGGLDLDEAARLLDGAAALVVNVASNVLGTLTPLGPLARLAHAAGAVVIADAAQAAGHVEVEPAAEGADVVAFTGHKGLLGPQGTGGVWVRDGLEVAPFCVGGTGGDSRRREMPSTMPDRLEAGTGNAPGLAGLLAGCRFLAREGLAKVHARETALKARLREALSSVGGLELLSPPAPDGAPVVTVRSGRVDAATLAERLDREHDVQTRAGIHCAPEVHAMLGTSDGGAVRFSLGWASSEEDVEAAATGVDAILRPATVPVGAELAPSVPAVGPGPAVDPGPAVVPGPHVAPGAPAEMPAP